MPGEWLPVTGASGTPLELLKDARRGGGRLGLHRHVEVVGHQHPPPQAKPKPLAQLAQDPGENLAEALAGEERHAPLGVGGKTE